MKLIKLTIIAAPEAHPNKEQTYSWHEPMPIEHLESAIVQLQAHVVTLKQARTDALAASKPIITGSPDLVFEAPK